MHTRVDRDPPSGRDTSPQHSTERTTTCANAQCQRIGAGTTLVARTEPYKLNSSAIEAAAAGRLASTADIQRSAAALAPC